MTFPSPTFVNVTVSGIITSPTAAPGTSTTQLATTAFVETMPAAPPAIGNTTPNTGAFTTLSATSTISGAGFTAWLASPPSIGNTAPGTGAFTTLAASGAVSGAGFDAYLASGKPGSFSTLAASGAVSGAGFDAYLASGKPGSFSTLAASGAVSGAGFTARLSTPGPIGDTVASTGAFTTLAASGAVSGAGITARFASPGPIGSTAASTGAFTTLAASSLTLTTNSASGQKVVASPTAPASTAVFTMQGVAGSITPATTGNVLLTISGFVASNTGTSGDGIQFQLSFGTGAAPASAAALTGTQVGGVVTYVNASAVTAGNVAVPFCTTAVVTGLTLGTAYWIDLAAKSLVTISSGKLANVNVSVIEFR